MNELELIKESLKNELNNPKNYEELVHQSASNIANLLILRPIFVTLNSKIEELKRKGQLKRNHKKILQSSVVELLKMIDDSNLNEKNALLIEKLILISLAKESRPNDAILVNEYIKIARNLSSSEIVVIYAASKRLSQGKLKDNLDIDDIYKDLAKLSGLAFSELIQPKYESLKSKGLFKAPYNAGRTSVENIDGSYVFTQLGMAFIDYIDQYSLL